MTGCICPTHHTHTHTHTHTQWDKIFDYVLYVGQKMRISRCYVILDADDFLSIVHVIPLPYTVHAIICSLELIMQEEIYTIDGRFYDNQVYHYCTYKTCSYHLTGLTVSVLSCPTTYVRMCMIIIS